MQFSLVLIGAFAALASAATPTLTNTFAPVATGCGSTDRSIVKAPGNPARYQVFCQSQPAGYVPINGALTEASQVSECVKPCNDYNKQVKKQFTCHAVLYTKFDKKCQLLADANGNISPRSDADYLVAHNF